MTQSPTTIECDVRTALEEAWLRAVQKHGGKDACFGPWPALWLTRELARLLNECHSAPMRDHAKAVKEMLLEHRYGMGGCSPETSVPIERQVEAVVEALETVRMDRLRSGEWTAQPAAQIMCG